VVEVLANCAGIAYNECMQYTIRKVPGPVDIALRRRAQEQSRSLNDVALEALARGAGVMPGGAPLRDLQDIAGTWRPDRAFERALAEQDVVDEEMWR
jgi:hypothetical protein